MNRRAKNAPPLSERAITRFWHFKLPKKSEGERVSTKKRGKRCSHTRILIRNNKTRKKIGSHLPEHRRAQKTPSSALRAITRFWPFKLQKKSEERQAHQTERKSCSGPSWCSKTPALGGKGQRWRWGDKNSENFAPSTACRCVNCSGAQLWAFLLQTGRQQAHQT